MADSVRNDILDERGPVFMNLKDLDIILRRIIPADLPQVQRLMAAVPWSTLLCDVTDLNTVRPDVQYGAFLGSEPEKLLSHVAVTRWGNDHAYLGWYVTDAKYRGRGIGSALFQWARRCTGEVNTYLDADPGMDTVYSRVGFHKTRQTHRIYGIVQCLPQSPKPNKGCECIEIRDLNSENYHYVATYDTAIYPVDRTDLLKISLISPPSRRSKFAFLNGKCVGYICLRETGNEFTMICPLVANDENIASLLLYHAFLENNMQGKHVEIFAPGSQLSKVQSILRVYGIGALGDVETVMCTNPSQVAETDGRVPWEKIYGNLFNNLTFI